MNVIYNANNFNLVEVGDVLLSNNSGISYLVVEESSEFPYRAIDLQDHLITENFKTIVALIKFIFGDSKYTLIKSKKISLVIEE